MTARSPEDVLAAIPEVLGFVPAESVVMLTSGGPQPFHARAPLPAPGCPSEVSALVGQLLEPARRHRVRGVVLVVYSGDETHARRVLRTLERAFCSSGIRVLFWLRAHDGRWWAPGSPHHGVPYDVGNHPFRVDSVLRGLVVHGSREELAATLDPDPASAARVAAHLGQVQPFDDVDLAACVSLLTARGEPFADADLAAAALGLRQVPVRDAAWAPVRRDDAAAHVRLWSEALPRTPDGLRGGPASVLAFAAWLAGHGALAWCAVDRAVDADPDNTLAVLVTDLLESAVPPTAWEESQAGDTP
jgi:hypothetical protein